MTELQRIIEDAFERRDAITPTTVDAVTRAAILQTIELLDAGTARVAEKIAGEWVVHQWLKKAVLLYFRINENQAIAAPGTQYYDKVPLKFADYTPERFKQEAIRVAPPGNRAQRCFYRPQCGTDALLRQHRCPCR